MDEEDRRILHEVLGRGAGFGHREHLELAWRYLAVHGGVDATAEAVADAIRQVAAVHGATGKFHETMTRSWAQCVAVHQERWPGGTFDEFLARNERLLDRKLLEHFYSPGLLGSQEARDRWVAPDRHDLPTTAS